MTSTDISAELVALAFVGAPLTADEAATVLESEVDRVVALVEELVHERRVTEDRTGISAVVNPLGATKTAVLAGRLAEVRAAAGAPGWKLGGPLYEAGRAEEAFEPLAAAVFDPVTPPERLPRITDLAVRAGEEARADAGRLAPLYVTRARIRRAAGHTEEALSDLNAATPHLEGEAQVDTLALAAVLADDLQHTSEAERLAAMASLVASQLSADAKWGSALVLHARELSRLGFEPEADAALAKGKQILEEHGSEHQRFYASVNQGWIELDRGWVDRADNSFTVARDLAERIEGEISVADKEAYRARALFGTGRAAEALEAANRAETLSARHRLDAPRFISLIARVEGALAFQRFGDAVEGCDRLAEIVAERFPSWANRAAVLRAQALVGAGRLADAREAVAEGLARTPVGQDGHRLRLELEATALQAEDDWDEVRAVDIIDQLLQAGWLGTAARSMVEWARRRRDQDLAVRAAALAMRLGNPMLAALAVDAADAWGRPGTRGVALALRGVGRALPDGWRDDWLALPAVRAGLAAIDEEAEDDTAELARTLDETLTAVGLTDSAARLSPAQRRAAGVALKGAPTRARPVRALALVAVAVAASVGVSQLLGSPPPAVEAAPAVTTMATTTTLPIELRQVEVPENIGAQAPFAGGAARTGAFEAAFDHPTGVYWRRTFSGFGGSPPVIQGAQVFFGTTQGDFYDIDLRTGQTIFSDTDPDLVSVSAAPIAELLKTGRAGGTTSLALYGGTGGVLVGHAPTNGSGRAFTSRLDGPVSSSPLVLDSTDIFVATEGGTLYRLDTGGNVTGSFPAEGEPRLSPVSLPLSASGGVMFAVDGSGVVHQVEVESMTETCNTADTGVKATSEVVIAGDSYFFATDQASIYSFPVGRCDIGSLKPYPVGTATALAPVVTEGTVWSASDNFLRYCYDCPADEPSTVGLDARITNAPVLSGNRVLVGVDTGELVAVDVDTKEVVWRFPLGAETRVRPAVIPGAVVVFTIEGELIAIAGE